MAKVIKVNVRDNNLNVKIPVENKPIEKKNIPDEIQDIQKPATTHMLLTVSVNGWARIPDVGETVKCKKQMIYPFGCNAISVSNHEGAVCGYIFPNHKNVLHGTVLNEDRFNVLPEKFIGTVVEHGSFLQHKNHLMMIAVECPVKDKESSFTVVSPGQNLLAPYGSIFTAQKEPRFGGTANVFTVYDGPRHIGVIAPKSNLAIPGTEILSLLDANNYPDSFKVKVVGDGCYDGSNHAIKVQLILPHAVEKLTSEEIAAADKKILKKYLAYLLREGECSTSELMLLSDSGKKKKEMLDKKHQEIMQNSAQKLNAYFNLL